MTRLTAAILVLALRLAAAGGAQVAPTATTGASVRWDYDDADLAVGPVAIFMVCLDAQPTPACTQVAASTGVASATAGTTTYSWKLPPLLAGAHTVAIQACTAAGAACSNGATLRFTFQAIADPKNLRLGGGA